MADTSRRTHTTNSREMFQKWIPEVNGLLYTHFKVKKIVLTVEGNDGFPSTFIYEKREG